MRATKPFPLRSILVFNAQWGTNARLSGYAGGLDNESLERMHMDGNFDSLTSWHIDTQEALTAFVKFAKENYPGAGYGVKFIKKIVTNKELIDGEFTEEYDAAQEIKLAESAKEA